MKKGCIPYIFHFLLFFSFLPAINSSYQCSATETPLKYIIKNIEITGNRVTRHSVVLRELTFNVNDTVDRHELEKMFVHSRENILKTSLFNYVYFDTLTEAPNLMQVIVRLEERWYIWPEFHFNHADRNLSAWWEDRDFTRINYGLGITHYNFRGRREKLSVKGITGFTTQLGIRYENIYIDRLKKHSVNFGAYYETQNKLDYITLNNKPELFNADKVIFTKHNFFFRYSFRKKHHQSHRLVAAYTNYIVDDTVVSLNPDFLGSAKNHLEFLTLIYFFENDRTDLKYYPLKGSLFTFTLTSSGLLSNSFNKIELRTGYHRFFTLGKRWYANAGLKMQIAGKNTVPYIALVGFGYDDFLRGYEKYVMDGYNYLLYRSTLKFELLPVRIFKLNFLSFRQFNKIHLSSYLNLFFDAGYAYNYNDSYKNYGNNLVNKALYSTGAGLDLVTYYDKMLRIDFALNSIGETGVFISMLQKF
ncbi:MAG: hypothetical protein JXB00_01580 [Bacteroidales bacterium]|nr:hypothetical protein [Bacteroidales bacterium]